MIRLSLISFSILLFISLSGCEYDPGNEGYYPPPFNPPLDFFVESISNNTVKISWSSNYLSSVTVERSENNDSHFTMIQSNVKINYFIDTNLVNTKLYYYRFRGFTTTDTSYYSSLTIGIDSSSRLIQSIKTNKYSRALSISDDGTQFVVTNDEWGEFEVRQCSDLTLSTKSTSGHGGSGTQVTRFSSDSKKVAIGSGHFGLSITLSPFKETLLTLPDSFTIYDMFYFDQDKKIIALLQHNKNQYSTMMVIDVETQAIVQKIDSLSYMMYNSSMISTDRKKVLFRTSTGMYIINASPTVSFKFIPLGGYYYRFCFLKDSNTVIGIKNIGFDFINSQSGEIVNSVNASIYSGGGAVIYPNEKKIILYGYSHEVNIYDLKTGLIEQRVGNIGLDKYIAGFICSKNDDSFIILYSDGTLNKYSTVEFTKQWQKKY